MLIKKAQNTAEYAILIALVVAAAIGMQNYVKRGWQGRVADTSDDFVAAIGGAPEWGDISTVNVTAVNQFDDKRISSKSTQQVLEDKEVYTMSTGGTTDRDTIRRTKRADGVTGDFQEVSY